MLKVRYLVDTVTGLAGFVITLLVWLPTGYHLSTALMNIFAIIGLFRLNLIGAADSKKSRFQRLHFAGLSITIIALLLLYLNISFGNLLILPGLLMVALFHIIELLLNARKDYFNILHILIYLVGLVYITQVQYHYSTGLSESQTIAVLNLLIFSTLIFTGMRGLTKRTKQDLGVDETPIDYPDKE